jgi:hypothetical protein
MPRRTSRNAAYLPEVELSTPFEIEQELLAAGNEHDLDLVDDLPDVLVLEHLVGQRGVDELVRLR